MHRTRAIVANVLKADATLRRAASRRGCGGFGNDIAYRGCFRTEGEGVCVGFGGSIAIRTYRTLWISASVKIQMPDFYGMEITTDMIVWGLTQGERTVITIYGVGVLRIVAVHDYS